MPLINETMKTYEVEVTGRVLITVQAKDEWEAERIATEEVFRQCDLTDFQFEAEVLDEEEPEYEHN